MAMSATKLGPVDLSSFALSSVFNRPSSVFKSMSSVCNRPSLVFKNTSLVVFSSAYFYNISPNIHCYALVSSQHSSTHPLLSIMSLSDLTIHVE